MCGVNSSHACLMSLGQDDISLNYRCWEEFALKKSFELLNLSLCQLLGTMSPNFKNDYNSFSV